MSVKIGVSPISWTNDDMPELGRDTTVEQCLQEGREAGYRGFELGGKWPRDCLLYTSPSPRDKRQSRMPSSA